MYNEEEIEDSLAFCRDIKKYYENTDNRNLYSSPNQPVKQSGYDSYSVLTRPADSIIEKPASLSVIILREAMNLFFCIIIAFTVSQLITHYIGQHTKVDGISMEDTLHSGDYLIIDKLTYHFHEPERFDIIVFPYKKDYYIKRIIGLPNDQIEIVDGSIYINGELLSENYGKEAMMDGLDDTAKMKLGKDEYFVLGDNRNNSFDSRFSEVGNIKRNDIIGKAWLRIYPLDSIEFITHQ